MGAGPEFEYTKEELTLLAGMLINDDSDPINKLNELRKNG